MVAALRLARETGAWMGIGLGGEEMGDGTVGYALLYRQVRYGTVEGMAMYLP